jgi:hypothetical protein
LKTKPFLSLFVALILPSIACGLVQPGLTATQTAVAGTTVAAAWTDTPTPTFTPTLPTSTPTLTATPDPCAAENLAGAVREIQDLQVQFDNLSAEAAKVESEELPDKILELQELLQTALNQDPPPCLETLKDHQVKHMNFVIDTLLAFAEGADEETVKEGIENARREHDAYTLELARLLGIEIGTPTPKQMTYAER